MTRHPFFKSAAVTANPIPDVAPVTTTVFIITPPKDCISAAYGGKRVESVISGDMRVGNVTSHAASGRASCMQLSCLQSPIFADIKQTSSTHARIPERRRKRPG
jgi:hypothetical protein